ncbi:MAG TPA: hypothetical protein VMQ60_09130 [Acidobacteriaceae bacterium]|jgi:hypothetical protein|nr:hypothetical protein [Acidobacteriaceae bacterium]
MKIANKRVAVMLAAWAMLAPGMARARDPEQVARIPLGPMGYQTQLPQFMLAGNSMLTVHFVDQDHLLITFGLRQLVTRLADDPPDDDDRLVGANLVELPSGKVLAQTQWRMHDRGQYLWSLGHGRFLLRVRDRLTVLAPMQGVGTGDAFHEHPVLHFDRPLVALQVSADGDLLTVETTDRTPGNPGGGSVTVVDPAGTAPAPIQLNFYRLSSTGEGAESLVVASAGAIRAHSAIDLPITTAGFLDVIEGGKDQWLFNFDEHAGKVDELAEWDTTCFPQSSFIGHGEFVSIGCRGSAARQELAGFNLKGEEMWQQNFLEAQTALTFSFAPAAGRFALGRIVVNGPFDPEGTLTGGAVSQQEVRVLQSYNGKLLFRIDCTPVERAGQNFALSADGMRLAVVRETMVHHDATKDYDEYSERAAAVEVYALPPLSEQDQTAVKQVEAQAPRDTGARIDLSLERISTPLATDAAGAAMDSTYSGAIAPSSAITSGAGSAQGGESSAQAAASLGEQGVPAGAVVLGDPEPGTGRKRPTLYGPDESPEEKTTSQ